MNRPSPVSSSSKTRQDGGDLGLPLRAPFPSPAVLTVKLGGGGWETGWHPFLWIWASRPVCRVLLGFGLSEGGGARLDEGISGRQGATSFSSFLQRFLHRGAGGETPWAASLGGNPTVLRSAPRQEVKLLWFSVCVLTSGKLEGKLSDTESDR